MAVSIVINPRRVFRSFIESTKRWICIVAHRRAGKTFGVLQKLMIEIDQNKRTDPPPRYAYVAPTRDQAKDIAWGYLKSFTHKIPGIVINESDLKITYPSGATIRLYSGENFERMRGIYLDGVILDEPADIPPAAWATVIRPCLSDYQGWGWFIGTPKGKNAFHKRHLQADGAADWFSLVIKASESGILPQSELDDIRNDVTVSEDDYLQEYECDFTVGRPGAIYATDMAKAFVDGRVGPFPIDDGSLVHTTWDLGAPANTVVVYWQKVGLTTRIVDCDFGLIIKTGERVARMMAKGYNYGVHILPHDGANTSADAMSFAEKLTEAGLANVKVMQRGPHNAEDKRITAMSDMFSQLWFRETVNVEGGLIEAIECYHRKEHRLGGYVENKIVHDWSSHFCDSLGYWSEAIKLGMIPEASALRSTKPSVQRVDIVSGRL